ncbi:MAG: hypothetical protein WDN45_06550 [Caulobacteraceae bacterium]
MPVGEDQKQASGADPRHRPEVSTTTSGAQGFFPLTEPVIDGPGARVMSLRDGTAKMSKSDPSDASRINLLDDADAIAQKISPGQDRPGTPARRHRGPEGASGGGQPGGHLRGAGRLDQGRGDRRIRRQGVRGPSSRPWPTGRGQDRTRRQ